MLTVTAAVAAGILTNVSGAEITLSEQLKKIPRAVRPTLQAARRMVKAVAPKAREIAYQSQPPRSSQTMWKIARYALGDAYVVGTGIFPTHASLFFYRGRELDDASGLLQGGGKDLRYITLRTPADADRPAVKRVVRQAFSLERNAMRDARRRSNRDA